MGTEDRHICPSPYGPPRPKAVATLLCSDDFWPGTQTLLFSIKKHLPSQQNQASPLNTSHVYPPDIVVLITPNVKQEIRDALYPTFCNRLITVDPIPIPTEEPDASVGKSRMKAWESCGYTKLQIFGHSSVIVYEKILYIDSDCIVVKDVSPLLSIGVQNNTRVGLEAASPDIFPPDKFNAGVMVISPSIEILDDMLQKTESLESYDGGDTGFLNAYYPSWFKSMDSSARLPFGFNAQRFMFTCTHAENPKYWNVGIGNDLTIVHFSSSPKPWQNIMDASDTTKQADLLSEESSSKMKDVVAGSSLDKLWYQMYKECKRFVHTKRLEERKDMARKGSTTTAATLGVTSQSSSGKRSGVMTNRMVQKRYKELRRSGTSIQDAMKQARKEAGMSDDSEDPGKQVAAMFGMPL